MTRGFSLLEALVALSISAMVCAALWGLFWPFAARQRATEEFTRESRSIDAIFDLTEGLISKIPLREDSGNSHIGGSAGELTFLTFGPLTLDARKPSAFRLVREADALVAYGTAPSGSPFREVLASSLSAVEFKFSSKGSSTFGLQSAWEGSVDQLQAVELHISGKTYARRQTFSVEPLLPIRCVSAPLISDCRL